MKSNHLRLETPNRGSVSRRIAARLREMDRDRQADHLTRQLHRLTAEMEALRAALGRLQGRLDAEVRRAS